MDIYWEICEFVIKAIRELEVAFVGVWTVRWGCADRPTMLEWNICHLSLDRPPEIVLNIFVFHWLWQLLFIEYLFIYHSGLGKSPRKMARRIKIGATKRHMATNDGDYDTVCDL